MNGNYNREDARTRHSLGAGPNQQQGRHSSVTPNTRPVSSSGTRAVSNSNTTRPVQSPRPVSLQQILDEVRRGLEEQRKVKEDVRRMGLEVQKIADEYKKTK